MLAGAAAERITFPNRNGEQLDATLTLSDAVDVMVLQHGYASSKDGFHLAAIAQGLAERGGIGSLRCRDDCSNGTDHICTYMWLLEQVPSAKSCICMLVGGLCPESPQVLAFRQW